MAPTDKAAGTLLPTARPLEEDEAAEEAEAEEVLETTTEDEDNDDEVTLATSEAIAKRPLALDKEALERAEALALAAEAIAREAL